MICDQYNAWCVLQTGTLVEMYVDLIADYESEMCDCSTWRFLINGITRRSPNTEFHRL